jgi:uncharacterized protein (TIGR03067 family)
VKGHPPADKTIRLLVSGCTGTALNGTAIAMSVSCGSARHPGVLRGDTMLILKLAAVLGAFAVLNSLAIAQQAEPNTEKADKKTTPESLVGRYTITSGEKEGSKEPEERIKGTTVTFTKESVIVADKDKKEIYSASYKLDTKTTPCQITMTSKVEGSAGEIARGLIQQDKDDEKVVRLVYALPTGEIPTEFKTKEKQLMFVMKKESNDSSNGK